MLTYTDVRSVTAARATALTVGNFDGIHRGHQTLLETLKQIASECGAQTGLLTFDPHPLTLLRPEAAQPLLTTPQERLRLAALIGLDVGVVQPFTPEVAALSPAEFMGLLKQHLNLTALVVGPDFALGRNRAGNLDVLGALARELDYRLHVVPLVNWEGRSVHSSTIRALLMRGEVSEAADLLGRPYHATGVVVTGDHRGRTIGVPTANLELPADKLWPAHGVYATRTYLHIGADPYVYNSVTNLGVRPTVDGVQRRFETHLLDFPPPGQDGDLYGQSLTVEFVARLRGEQRFDSLAELVAQIHYDIGVARSLLAVPDFVARPFFLDPLPG
jgi:riboflavin kinase/FMN adenylyltransferase